MGIMGASSRLFAAASALWSASSVAVAAASAAIGAAESQAAVSRLTEKSSSSNVRKFHVLSSEEIFNIIHDLANRYPQFATLTDAQTEYGLPAAGSATDCPYDRDTGLEAGCRNYILTIEDKAVHPEGSTSAAELPEVFLSGCLHGNERVGPSSVTETASLLLEVAACVALPGSPGANQDELDAAIACRQDLDARGITDAHRRWLARLVSTRRIVIMPTANALGYYQNRRTEGKIDPNRDFPFDIEPEHSDTCMQTIAGRSINELFREHMFQLSLTFHAGMEAVTYEWGAPTYLNYMSPDDEAQAQLGQGYKRYAGHFDGTPDYKVGTMNDVVYYVRGGMEDWAYGGSFDPDRVVQCTPTTFGGYPPEKTTYNNSTLRMFNVLVEASDHKTPPADKTGTTEELLIPNGAGNGHIARNLRISLMAIDMVQPYVSILGADGRALEDDVVPTKNRANRSCIQNKAMLVANEKKEIDIDWTVGGGFAIDETRVLYGEWEDLPNSIDGSGHLTEEEVSKMGGKLKSVNAELSRGTTQWNEKGAQPSSDGFPTTGPAFKATIDTSSYKAGDQIAVFAVARVDSSWTHEPDNVKPEGAPQSHVVNARTNPDWHHESAGKIIQGRVLWYSTPLTLIVGNDDTETIDVSSRLKPPQKDWSSQITSNSQTSSGESWEGIISGHLMVAFATLCILAAFIGFVIIRRHRGKVEYSRAMMAQMDEFSDDLTFEEEDAFAGTSSSYHDNPNHGIELSGKSSSSNGIV